MLTRQHSRIGGATLKMPPSNFSSSGLARIFGIDLDDDIKAHPNGAHKKTAIIASTVCGVVGLALLVVLGGYAARKWRKKHTHPEDPVYEKDVHPDARDGIIDQDALQH